MKKSTSIIKRTTNTATLYTHQTNANKQSKQETCGLNITLSLVKLLANKVSRTKFILLNQARTITTFNARISAFHSNVRQLKCLTKDSYRANHADIKPESPKQSKRALSELETKCECKMTKLGLSEPMKQETIRISGSQATV